MEDEDHTNLDVSYSLKLSKWIKKRDYEKPNSFLHCTKILAKTLNWPLSSIFLSLCIRTFQALSGLMTSQQETTFPELLPFTVAASLSHNVSRSDKHDFQGRDLVTMLWAVDMGMRRIHFRGNVLSPSYLRQK